MVCILLSMPIIITAFVIGLVIQKAILKQKQKNDIIKSSIVPLLTFIVLSFGEAKLTISSTNVISVESKIILDYTPLEVYNAIKSVDTLDAEKPFLMKLDLPIPQKCILKEEKVGGIRTCYFEGGRIIERITKLEKGKILEMDVIKYELTGRKWLGFKQAIYHFKELEKRKTEMTRITTYTSELYPRVYWEPLEKTGIEQEHKYVFDNLLKDLKSAHSIATQTPSE